LLISTPSYYIILIGDIDLGILCKNVEVTSMIHGSEVPSSHCIAGTLHNTTSGGLSDGQCRSVRFKGLRPMKAKELHAVYARFNHFCLYLMWSRPERPVLSGWSVLATHYMTVHGDMNHGPLRYLPCFSSGGSKQKNCAHFEESMKRGMDKP